MQLEMYLHFFILVSSQMRYAAIENRELPITREIISNEVKWARLIICDSQTTFSTSADLPFLFATALPAMLKFQYALSAI